MEEYYSKLGVKSSASDEEIKIAFREKAKELHPDKNHSTDQSEEDFKTLQEAYNEIISQRDKELNFQINSVTKNRSENKTRENKSKWRSRFIHNEISLLWDMFRIDTSVGGQNYKIRMNSNIKPCHHKLRSTDIYLICK